IRLATAVLAVGGGLLTNAACPDLNWWAAAFPGVALLVLALEPDSARWGFVSGTLFGLGFFLPHLIWADSAVGWIPWVALSLVQALFCGALGIAWVWARRLPAVWRSPWFRSIVFAVLWVAFEYGRSIWPFGGFPWGRLATSQADSPLARLAWLGGVPLVSGAAAWAGALLAQAIIALRRWRIVRASGLVLGVAALIVAAFFVPLDTRAESGSLAVGAVQGNVPVPGLDAFAQQRQVLHNHALGTRALAERPNPTPLDLVLWPENGSDIDPRTDAGGAGVRPWIDVRAVLRPEDEVERRRIRALRQCARAERVVVQHLALLSERVEAWNRHVALDGADGEGTGLRSGVERDEQGRDDQGRNSQDQAARPHDPPSPQRDDRLSQ